MIVEHLPFNHSFVIGLEDALFVLVLFSLILFVIIHLPNHLLLWRRPEKYRYQHQGQRVFELKVNSQQVHQKTWRDRGKKLEDQLSAIFDGIMVAAEAPMPSHERVEAFIALVEQSRFVKTIETFYTEDASMQENLQPLSNAVSGFRKSPALTLTLG